MTEVRKPYINDALVGNGRLLATIDSKGKLLRAFWPHVDYGQHIGDFTVSVAHDKRDTMKSLHAVDRVSGAYQENTNILTFTYEHPDFEVRETTFAAPMSDVLVRHFSFANAPSEDIQIGVSADIPIYEVRNYQSTRFEGDEGILVHYFRDVYIAIGGSQHPTGYQCGGVTEEWATEQLSGNAIVLSSKSALSFPMERNELTLFIAFGHTLEEAVRSVVEARTTGYQALLRQSEESAENYLRDISGWPVSTEEKLREAGATETAIESVRRLYYRSILTFQLLQDETGAMIAAPEFDEGFTRCGGYAYCWGRDAAYIVTAFEHAGMLKQSRAFYEWAIRVQEKSGVWEHRHYMDGRLAPAWGIQLDETASLLWGMAQHIKFHRDDTFISTALPAMKRAADYLVQNRNAETGLPVASMDLWEERKAEHIYSAAAISGALREFADIAEAYGDISAEDTLNYRQASAQIADAVYDNYSTKRQSFLRGRNLLIDGAKAQQALSKGEAVSSWTDEYGYVRYALERDEVVDVSLLGLAVPFAAVDVLDERMQATARAVETHLTREVGGIGRYEGDQYIGGNPWILATLWLAIYQLRQGRQESALEQFWWAVQHQTTFGFLPEQVDRHTGKTAWVVPLAWSHAMYVWFVHELSNPSRL